MNNDKISTKKSRNKVAKQHQAARSLKTASDYSFRVWRPKYVALIFGLLLIQTIIYRVSIFVLFLVWVGALIWAYAQSTKLLSQSPESLSKRKKTMTVLAMAIAPLFAQAVYYIRLHEEAPSVARTFNRIGWQVLATEAGIVVFLTIIVVVIKAS